MPMITLAFGSILIALGVVGYFVLGGDDPHWTALIPAIIGVLFELLGAVALVGGKARKHAMHAACVLALIAIGGTAGGLMKLPKLIAGEELERPSAVGVQAAVCALSIAFLVACIVSFVRARLSGGSAKSAA